MEQTFTNPLLVFGYSCLLGAGLGLLYDFFRILRIAINPKNITIFIEDVIYFIISGIITFIFVLGFNQGEARFYIVAGEGIGWIVYHLTLGEFIYKRCSCIIRYMFRCFNSFFSCIKNIFCKVCVKNKQIESQN